MIGRDLEIILRRKPIDVDYYNEARRLLSKKVYIFNSNSELGKKLVEIFIEIGHLNILCPTDPKTIPDSDSVVFICSPQKSPRFYDTFPSKSFELCETVLHLPNDIENLRVVVEGSTKVSGESTYGVAMRLNERIAVERGWVVARLPSIAESRMNEFYGIARAHDLAVVQDNIRPFISLDEGVYTLLRLAGHNFDGVWTFHPAHTNSTLKIAKTMCPHKDVVWAENYPQREEVLSQREYEFTQGEEYLRRIISYD